MQYVTIGDYWVKGMRRDSVLFLKAVRVNLQLSQEKELVL